MNKQVFNINTDRVCKKEYGTGDFTLAKTLTEAYDYAYARALSTGLRQKLYLNTPKSPTISRQPWWCTRSMEKFEDNNDPLVKSHRDNYLGSYGDFLGQIVSGP